jgi:hypothetical protein
MSVLGEYSLDTPPHRPPLFNVAPPAQGGPKGRQLGHGRARDTGMLVLGHLGLSFMWLSPG